jgi:hypothetical protein
MNTPDKTQPNNLITSIDDLSGRLSVLEEHIEKLEPVLSPILKPDQPCDPPEPCPANLKVATSDLRDAIENHMMRVNNLITKVGTLMRRVDL